MTFHDTHTHMPYINTLAALIEQGEHDDLYPDHRLAYDFQDIRFMIEMVALCNHLIATGNELKHKTPHFQQRFDAIVKKIPRLYHGGYNTASAFEKSAIDLIELLARYAKFDSAYRIEFVLETE